MGSTIIVLTLLLTALLGYLRHLFNYWSRRGVPQLKVNILYGHFFKLKSVHMSELLQETYDAFKHQGSLAGTYIFARPIAVVTDLDLVKTILIKDFNKFVDRSNAYLDLKHNPLSGHLFNLNGDDWRALRTKLSPTFTSGKIKYMFGTVTEVAEQLKQAVQREVSASQGNGAILELHDLVGRYTVDVIGSCAFGIACNSLEDPQAEFRVVGRKLFSNPNRSVPLALFNIHFTDILRKLGIRPMSFGGAHNEFFMRIVRETVESRTRQNIRRNDFMDLLLDLHKSDQSEGLSIYQLAAQVFVFFVAGFETSSSNVSYALFELAKNQAIQDKLRDEIERTLKKHEKLTYEAMTEMSYMDQVVNETLRKYPALASLTRIASEDYRLPGNDGHMVVERDTTIHIPIRAIHYDPEIYPEPYKFQPERFEPAAILQRHPLAFLGFGDGPRNCIGLRFGRMQVKVALVTLLSNYRFSPAPNQPTEAHVGSKSLLLIPSNGVRLHVEQLSKPAISITSRD